MRKNKFLILFIIFFLFNNVIVNAETKKLDINKTTVEEIMKVKGIGKKKAEAIINFIKQRKGIKNMNELLEVKGVGKKTLENIKKMFEVKESYKKK